MNPSPSLPPFWGPPLSTLPAPAPLPSMPSQEELDAALALFDKLAEQDTARRMAKVTRTARPPRKSGKAGT